jgi:hypothetical protein
MYEQLFQTKAWDGCPSDNRPSIFARLWCTVQVRPLVFTFLLSFFLLFIHKVDCFACFVHWSHLFFVLKLVFSDSMLLLYFAMVLYVHVIQCQCLCFQMWNHRHNKNSSSRHPIQTRTGTKIGFCIHVCVCVCVRCTYKELDWAAILWWKS